MIRTLVKAVVWISDAYYGYTSKEGNVFKSTISKQDALDQLKKLADLFYELLCIPI